MRKIELEQGSPEWLEYRRTRIGASDAAVIMGLSPWKTPYQLWKEKIEGTEQRQTGAMRRGKELEPVARSKFNEQFGFNVEPAVFENSSLTWQFASLDGYSEFYDVVWEGKCGSIKLHEEANLNIIPEYYECQLQHILSVMNELHEIHYSSYSPQELQPLRTLTRTRDYEFIEKMNEKELEFLECVRTLTPPALTEKDYELIENPRGSDLLKEYVELSEKEKELQKRKDSIKEEIIALGNEKNFILDGAKIYQTTRTSYDYTKMRNDGISVDLYKKNSAPYWMISTKRASSKSF